MRRFGVILLLLFEVVWLNAFLPGHTRGVIALADAGESSCHTKCCEKPQKPDQKSERAGRCAVCFFAARLTVPATLDMTLPPLALVDEAPVPPAPQVISLDRPAIFDSRGPPIF